MNSRNKNFAETGCFLYCNKRLERSFLDKIYAEATRRYGEFIPQAMWERIDVEEQLFELAETNTPRLHRGRIVPMSIAISKMAGENPTHAYENFDFTKSGKDDFIPMYVATNETCITGASIILYTGLLEAVSEELGSFIVIPSSVHELILVPCTCCDNVPAISAMVREINATEVLETEILSDKCLFYDAESHTLEETE